MQRALLIAALWIASTASGQVRTDGSLGPAVDVGPGMGADYLIDEGLGQLRGSNLFHSFETFDVFAGEVATFSGQSAVSNLLVRVTGGDGTNIDGTLRSTLGQANLFFVDRSGVTFGPNATIDIGGSLHVSSADAIQLEHGGIFLTDTTSGSLLTAAEPAAFGFLSDAPAGLGVEGFLETEMGRSLQLVGGDITIDAARGPGVLSAPGGEVRLVSVGSPGVVAGSLDFEAMPDLSAFERLGHIEVTDTAAVSVAGLPIAMGDVVDLGKLVSNAPFCGDACIALVGATANPRASDVLMSDQLVSGRSLVLRVFDAGAPAGRIQVAGDSLLIENSELRATSLGTEGGRIDVKVRGELTLAKTQMDEVNVGILARNDERSAVPFVNESFSFTGFSAFEPIFDAGTFPIGAASRAGDISVQAGSIVISGGARIAGTSITSGEAGSIQVSADGAIHLMGRDTNDATTPSGIFANAQGDGRGGDVRVMSEELVLADGAAIIAQTSGNADAGNIRVEVDSLEIHGDAQIDNSTSAQSLQEGGVGMTLGNGGTILVRANERVLLSGGADASPARISTRSAARSAGRAGSIEIHTPLLELEAGAGIQVLTEGPGTGGNILLDVADLRLEGGSTLTAESTGSVAAGNAGGIIIGPAAGEYPNQTIELVGGSAIRTGAVAAAGGDIRINADKDENAPLAEALLLRRSSITTSVTGGMGDGGNITIDPVFVILDGGRIIAQADEGSGGDIRIRAEFFVPSGDSVVSASASQGVDGTVVIESPEVDLSAGLASLPETFLDVTALLRDRCAARASGEPSGSFLVSGDRVLISPDDYLPSAPLAPSLAAVADGKPCKARAG